MSEDTCACCILLCVFLGIFNMIFMFSVKPACLIRNCKNDENCLSKDDIRIYTDLNFNDICATGVDFNSIDYDCYCTDTNSCGKNLFSDNIFKCLLVYTFIWIAMTLRNF